VITGAGSKSSSSSHATSTVLIATGATCKIEYNIRNL